MNVDQTPPAVPSNEPDPDLFAYLDDERPGDYRVLNVEAVLSLAFGLLSVLTVFSWYLAFLPLAGLAFAWIARRRIQRAPEELTGMRLAVAGAALSVVLWITGMVVLTMSHMQSVPIGYTEISFHDLQPDLTAGEYISSKAIDLNDKRIYITGFMYPGRQNIRIKEFLLVPTAGHCKFCSTNIAPTEIMRVRFSGDLRADFTTNRIGVGGKLVVDKTPGFRDSGGFPYTLEADCLQE
jgi:hypothetical protein